MTESQHQLYLRRWAIGTRRPIELPSVAQSNNWVMRKGRLSDAAVGPDASEWHAKVWAAANQLAAREHCAPTAHHLRHAGHIAAFGRAKSSKDLTNSEFNRLLILWGNEREMRDGGMKGLLVDPLDLASISAWNNPEAAQRTSFVVFLGQLGHEAALIAISEKTFGTKNWHELPMENLRWLCKQIKSRSSGRESAPSRRYETDPEKVPF